MNLTQQQVEQHNGFYSEAWKLIVGEITLDGQELPAPSWFTRLRLNKAKGLFEKSVAINPTGWNAMFAIGKIEQRLGRKKEALDWLLKAREFEPSNTSLAKEASLSASHLGQYEMAARIADEAIENNQTDPALRVNSGLAHILAGHCKLAAERFGEACRLEPDRDLNRKLEMFATRVCAGLTPLPKSEAEIIRFVDKVV